MNVLKPGEAFKVTVKMCRRADGGLRVWSDDVPGLVLSNSDPAKVLSDIGPALEFILGEMLGQSVVAQQLTPLPAVESHSPATRRRAVQRAVTALPPIESRGSMEYAALACG